jgi:hypothetical protein
LGETAKASSSRNARDTDSTGRAGARDLLVLLFFSGALRRMGILLTRISSVPRL